MGRRSKKATCRQVWDNLLASGSCQFAGTLTMLDRFSKDKVTAVTTTRENKKIGSTNSRATN